jgi:hypothetical protein
VHPVVLVEKAEQMYIFGPRIAYAYTLHATLIPSRSLTLNHQSPHAAVIGAVSVVGSSIHVDRYMADVMRTAKVS